MSYEDDYYDEHEIVTFSPTQSYTCYSCGKRRHAAYMNWVSLGMRDDGTEDERTMCDKCYEAIPEVIE